MINALKAKFRDRIHSFAQTSLGITHFEDIGPRDGDVIVLIHGVSGPLAVWDKTVPALLSSGYRIIRLDLFGRGMSERLAECGYGLPIYLQQIEELLAYLNVERPITVVGSSFGAVIAAEYALQHPDRVRGVVLVGPAGFPIHVPLVAKLGSVPILGDLIFRSFGVEAIKTRNRKYFVDENPPAELWSYFIAQLAVPGTAESMRETMSHAPVQSFIASYGALGASGIPVGVIWGRQDVTFDYRYHTSLLKQIPGASLVTIENAGHLPQYEQPDQTGAALILQLSTITQSFNNKIQSQLSSRLRFPSEPNRTLNAPAVSNTELFEADFFRQWPSVKKSIPLGDGVTKDYLFPTFYNRVVTSLAMFTCDYHAAAKLIEDPSLEPVKLGATYAIITISSYRYNEVRGIAPYNEVAVSVLVRSRGQASGPITTLVSLAKLQGIEAYVLSMPVTTLENQIRGRTIWGLPKDVRAIGLRQVGSEFVTTVWNDCGEKIYQLSVPMTGTEKMRQQKLRLRSVLKNQPLVSVTESIGDYVVTTSLGGLLPKPLRKSFLIGRAPEGQWLRDLKINAAPFHTEFSLGTMNMLSSPDSVVSI